MLFYIYRGFKPNGDEQTRLINSETMEGNAADYFVAGTEDIAKVGQVEVLGDTDLLGECYVEDL